MPILHTFEYDHYGIPLTVRGSYVPADPSVGLGASFEIYDIRARLVRAKDIPPSTRETLAELDISAWHEDVIAEIVGELTGRCEDELDASAIDAWEARQAAREAFED